MTDIALVVFRENEKKSLVKTDGLFKSFVPKMFLKLKESLLKGGFFRTSFGTRLYYWFRKKEFTLPNDVIMVSDKFRFQIIKLPFNLESLSYFNNNYLEKIINRNLSNNGISFCHVPTIAKNKGFFTNFEGCISYDKILLKMLLDPVLTNMYSKKSDRIGDLDILILAGENTTEALEAISILEPRIRYVSISASHKEEVENEAEKIFGDEGLSISVVNDYKAALKNADLVLNFTNELPTSHKIKVKTEAIVFNLSDDDISRAFPENLVINGLVPDLPKQLATSLGRQIFQYYSRKELAELAISYIAGLTPGTVFNSALSHRVKQDFDLYGFRIAGLKGRHGIFRFDALQKLAMYSS